MIYGHSINNSKDKGLFICEYKVGALTIDSLYAQNFFIQEVWLEESKIKYYDGDCNETVKTMEWYQLRVNFKDSTNSHGDNFTFLCGDTVTAVMQTISSGISYYDLYLDIKDSITYSVYFGNYMTAKQIGNVVFVRENDSRSHSFE
jgi:hypothetical protein